MSLNEDSIATSPTECNEGSLNMDGLEELDFDIIEDMPWAQNLWKKVERHSKKGFLNWCKIVKKVAGTKEDDVTTWNTEYLRSVDDVFCDMVAEMSRIHSSTINKMQQFFTRLEKACIALHQPMPQIKEQGLSLYEAQQQLLKYVKEYEVVINAKKLDLDNLNKKQIKLCKELDQKPQYNLEYPPLPTQAQFDNLKKHIDKLEAEKFEREEKFVNFKHEITEIVDKIKYKPNSDFERQVLSSDDMMLSNENLKNLEFFAKCIKELKISTEEEVSHLRTRIEDLWKMLDIELIDRDEFRTHYTGSSLETLEALKVEVKRCEELRKANIKNFVDKLRDQLQIIWKKCQCSDADKKSFRYYNNDFYTEDLLDLHELEIQKWKKYYEDNSKILDIIKKHQELWDKMIQFEENATGANRFKNRGGQLLQEEKERNKLSKLIPQLEEQMVNLSEEFLNKNGRTFMTFGCTVEEYIQRLHEARENDRKTKLSARKLQRTETTVRTPGKSSACLFPPSISRCTTVTPKTLASSSKRKIFATPNTENKAKRPKANTAATVGARNKGTPRELPKIKVTHATMSLPKQRRSRSFQEKQKMKRALRQSREKENAVPNSNETRDTTYSEFQTWQDLRSRTKIKAGENKKRANATGGRPVKQDPISDIEEQILEIVKKVSIGGHDIAESTCLFNFDDDMEVDNSQEISDSRRSNETNEITEIIRAANYTPSYSREIYELLLEQPVELVTQNNNAVPRHKTGNAVDESEIHPKISPKFKNRSFDSKNTKNMKKQMQKKLENLINSATAATCSKEDLSRKLSVKENYYNEKLKILKETTKLKERKVAGTSDNHENPVYL